MSTFDYPNEISPEELALGFKRQVSGGFALVMLEIGGGLRAVKRTAAEGVTEYALCDGELNPLYQPARTLDELRARFGI